MAKKETTKHICSECINEFDGKDLFHALKKAVIGDDYYTIYCSKCIKKLEYTEFTPYYIKKEIKEKKPAVKKPTTKTPRVKK